MWGNLAFTGTLLLATYWHIDEFNWTQFETPMAHIWIVLYIFEPVMMLYLIPRGIFAVEAPVDRRPAPPLFKGWLVLLTGLFLMHGLLLVAQPEFAAARWPWELNPLDARMVAAWFLGWSVWCGTMAFARDWDEIRRGIQLLLLNGIALLATVVLFRDEFIPGRDTIAGYGGALAVADRGGGRVLCDPGTPAADALRLTAQRLAGASHATRRSASTMSSRRVFVDELADVLAGSPSAPPGTAPASGPTPRRRSPGPNPATG